MSDPETFLTVKPRGRLVGREVGRLAYGCWRLPGTPQDALRGKIDAALEIGANIIDTAAVYGAGAAEEMLGVLLSERPSFRDEIVLVTKGGITPPVPYNSSRQELIASCEASLRRLKSDAVDVFLVHRPDFLTSPAEVAEALNELIWSGKTHAVGVSNYSPEQTRALQSFLDVPLAVTQPEFSALHTQPLFDGTLDHAQSASVIPLAWSPLAGGSLATGRAPDRADLRAAGLVAVLDRIANDNGSTRECVALAWLLAHPAGVVPIIGTQSPERIRAAAGAFEIKMSRRDWYEILEASRGERMP
ncbi:aldo/keto reductase [Hoeflea poritis]|uniref:Aldo/keto reductase n=1 Tax=Hoeflea poritis TaxID=2993659 RepID=A0ABT4VIH3_9HYPH|nr:aldo/keto reductase [Hoeflea poritis]MDA4844498.1 aldo/keto reductase [Hoeflea poritis]